MFGAPLALGAFDYSFMATMGNWPTLYSCHVSSPYFLIEWEASPALCSPKRFVAMSHGTYQVDQRVPR